MPKIKRIAVPFPQGGTVKAGPYEDADYSVTQLSKNIWPLDIQSSRVRGGPRPGLTTLAPSSIGSGAYGWCRANWVTGTTPNFTTNRGVAAIGANGTFTTTDGVTWDERCSTNVSTPFASCAVHTDNYVYQAQCAAADTVIKRCLLNGGAEETLTAEGGKGTAPTGCGVAFSHQDRMVFAGNAELPHVHYWSAAGNARDWLYSSRLSTGAFAATGSNGIAEPIIAGMSASDDRALFGCRNSIYEVIGNPRTARIRRLSRNVGPLNNKSWCLDASNNIWLWTTAGPYRIDAAAGSYPQPVGGKIPNDLISIQPGAGDTCSVGYDHRWSMIHFNADPNSGDDVSWVYHIPSETWWSQTLSDDVGHLAISFPELMSADKSSLLLVGGNGAVYQYNRANTSEDFDNFLWLGPIRLWDDFNDGVVQSVRAVLAKFTDLWSGSYTGNLNWALHVGNSSEVAFNSTAAFTGTAFDLEGLNYDQNPMVRGNTLWIKVYDASNEKWLYESILLEIQDAGRRLVA